MEEHEIRHYPPTLPIPKEFFSYDTGAPFDRCMLCKTFLLAPGVGYVIEKAYKRHADFKIEDVVFEYAMCESCAMEMSSAMSEESMQNVSNYFAENVDFYSRQRYLLEEEAQVLSDWIGQCIIKGTTREEMTEYQIMGQFVGEEMIFQLFPYMIGGAAMGELSGLLSNKTLGEIDGFMDNFGLPPELRELLKDRPIMVF